MTGSLIISLDFEMMWGVRDHRTTEDYGDAVLGVRQAVPLILSRFAQNGIRATWATVGLLFARSRDEALTYSPSPALRPKYREPALSPYAFIENGLGKNEAEDPMHFGRSVIDRIADTEGQELATHTFSHFYCLENGGTCEAFGADLDAALAIASDSGHKLQSIVFPRNQMSLEHLQVAASRGITRFRGNPAVGVYRPRSKGDNSLAIRAMRYADSMIPLFGWQGFERPEQVSGITNLEASRFLRPWDKRLPAFSSLHIARVKAEMERAARLGLNYHLWWHPHNMGRNIAENIGQLDEIIQQFLRLRNEFGFRSKCMDDFS